MKKGQILEGVIEKVEFPNKGLVYVVEEDQYVLVKNGIPGQKIRFGINKFKHGRAEEDCWKCWNDHRWRRGNRCAVCSPPAEDACIRRCHMKRSWK